MKELEALPETGDLFTISISSGAQFIGVILSINDGAMVAPTCAFTTVERDNTRADQVIDERDIISVQDITGWFTSKDNWSVFTKGAHFSVPEYQSSPHRLQLLPPRLRTLDRLPLEVVIGSTVMSNFLEACVGIRPWNENAWSDYYDGLLLSPNVNFPRVIYST